MSKELHEWAFNVLSGMNASKYEKRLSEELPAAPADCAKALRYISAKHKWKTRISVRGRWIAILVISKAKGYEPVKKRKKVKPIVAKRASITKLVEAVMLEMKPREARRFVCDPSDYEAARTAVYAVKSKIGGRFSASKSTDGHLLIIRS